MQPYSVPKTKFHSEKTNKVPQRKLNRNQWECPKVVADVGEIAQVDEGKSNRYEVKNHNKVLFPKGAEGFFDGLGNDIKEKYREKSNEDGGNF